jgi:hypothetical protein
MLCSPSSPWQVVINNLDALIMEPVARTVFANMATESPHLLADIEALYKSRFQDEGRAGPGSIMLGVQQRAHP